MKATFPPASHLLRSPLWRNQGFLKLWFGQSISQLGSQVTFLALPLVAILTLNATPFQMGALVAVGALPSLAIGPLVGAYVDRHRRRRILITADWARAAVLATIPVAYLTGVLSIAILFAVALVMGVLGLLFDVSYRSFLPSVVAPAHLLDGNSKLELGRSGAEIGGPGLGGVLVQAAGGPFALCVDAATFVVSALSLHSIEPAEAKPRHRADQRSLWRDAVGGLRWLAGERCLRDLAIVVGTVALFNAMLEAVWLLYATGPLAITPALIGVILGTGSAGLVVGALFAERIAVRLGVGPSIAAAVLLAAASDLALPLATGPVGAVVAILIVGQFAFGIGLTTFNISQVSFRQATAADHQQGRMNAGFRVATGAAIPVGALVGGLLGEVIGLRQTLFVAVIGEASAAVWLLISPVRSVQALPTEADVG